MTSFINEKNNIRLTMASIHTQILQPYIYIGSESNIHRISASINSLIEKFGVVEVKYGFVLEIVYNRLQ